MSNWLHIVYLTVFSRQPETLWYQIVAPETMEYGQDRKSIHFLYHKIWLPRQRIINLLLAGFII